MAGPPQFPEPANWHLVVAGVEDLTPYMRRIRLSGSELAGFHCLPGQDLALAFVRDDGLTVRRRYTVRRFDRDRRWIDLDFVMHGDGPGMRWAKNVQAGGSVDAIGPRGKITLAADADWHLFAGDTTAVPGALAMLEALPEQVPGHAFLQIDNAQERQPFDSHGELHQVRWQFGTGTTPSLGSMIASADLPKGRGHAYLAGEVSLVLSLKQALVASGWVADRISAKAYWNLGRANAGNGEPEQRAA